MSITTRNLIRFAKALKASYVFEHWQWKQRNWKDGEKTADNWIARADILEPKPFDREHDFGEEPDYYLNLGKNLKAYLSNSIVDVWISYAGALPHSLKVQINLETIKKDLDYFIANPPDRYFNIDGKGNVISFNGGKLELNPNGSEYQKRFAVIVKLTTQVMPDTQGYCFASYKNIKTEFVANGLVPKGISERDFRGQLRGLVNHFSKHPKHFNLKNSCNEHLLPYLKIERGKGIKFYNPRLSDE